MRNAIRSSYASFLMPHCPVTVVQRYRDGVCSFLFHSFFIICHPYIPLHLEFILVILLFGCANAPSTIKRFALYMQLSFPSSLFAITVDTYLRFFSLRSTNSDRTVYDATLVKNRA